MCVLCRIIINVLKSANVAHLVERHLAKVEVASSSLVVRSNMLKASAIAGAFSSDILGKFRLNKN